MIEGYRIAKALLVCLLPFGCGDSVATPRVDGRYSELLTVLGQHYAAISGDKASATVGVVQIFSGSTRRVDTLLEASSGELLLESRQRDLIDELIASIQHVRPEEDPQCDLGRGPDWILVAHDSELFRVGVIRLYLCGRDESVVGIRPIGDAAIVYSREAATFMRSHGLVGTIQN